jgi:hypothetical protein
VEQVDGALVGAVEGKDLVEQAAGLLEATEAVVREGGEQAVLRVTALLEVFLKHEQVRQRGSEVVDARGLANAGSGIAKEILEQGGGLVFTAERAK